MIETKTGGKRTAHPFSAEENEERHKLAISTQANVEEATSVWKVDHILTKTRETWVWLTEAGTNKMRQSRTQGHRKNRFTRNILADISLTRRPP